MAQQEPCDHCGDKQRCQETFRQMGNAQGRSVVRSVLVAFVLPLIVFIGVLAIAQQFLIRRVESVELRTALAVLPAFGAALICAMAAGMIGKRLGRK